MLSLAVQLQSAIGSFYQPVVPLSDETRHEYFEPVRNIARRFFHHLMRFISLIFYCVTDILDKLLFNNNCFLGMNSMKKHTAWPSI